jgi:hypothetical protein
MLLKTHAAKQAWIVAGGQSYDAAHRSVAVGRSVTTGSGKYLLEVYSRRLLSRAYPDQVVDIHPVPSGGPTDQV